MSDPRFPSVRYLFFGLAGLSLLMSSIDSTIVAVAIPQLGVSLGAPLSWIGWTLTGYQLAQIVVMPLVGRLSDELGRKRVFMFCLGSFTIGSLLCGLAPNIWLLIFFRVIQAFGGGGLMPSAVGIVSDQFKERRNQAIGLFTSILPIGGIIGPNIGGWILEHWSWREIFFVNVPVGLAVLAGVQLLLRDQRRVGRAQRIDFPGLALFASAMVVLMYAFTTAGTDPGVWRSPLFWSLLAGAIILLALFGRQEQHAEQPVVEIPLVIRRPFLQANLYNFLYGACAFGFFSFIPYFAVVQYHMTVGQSGAVLTPRALAMIGMSAATSLFLLRLGYRLPMIAGMLMLSAGLLLLSFGLPRIVVGPVELDGFWVMAFEVAITGLGVGMAAPAANNATIDLLPSRAAAITGLRGMFRLSGGIVGISSVVLALSFFPDQAAGMRAAFLVIAVLLLITIPLTLMIPDTARERRAGKLAPAPAQLPPPASAEQASTTVD